ncbi:hypothetical protein JCM19379_22890 [Methyloparacoccus murrellii]
MPGIDDYRARAGEQLSGELPAVDLICGATVTPEPIEWLWFEWLAAGKLEILAGPPGTGKTTIAAALCATLSSGGRWPDGTRAEAGNALIWSGEDDPKDTLAPRLLACGADMRRIYFVGDVRDGDEELAFDPARHMDALTRAATKIGGVKLLIVDPIVSAIAGDSHKNAEVRRGLQPLVTLAAKLNCAVLGISHFTKGTSGRDPVERFNGSIAFGALARVTFVGVKMPAHDQGGGSRLFCRAKSNIGPDSGGFRYDLEQVELEHHAGVFASRLVWGEAVDGTARELLVRAEALPPEEDNGDDEPEAPECAIWLRDFLASGPKTAKEVFAAGRDDGYSKDQIKRAKARLGVTSGKHAFNGPWAWAMPEGSFNNPADDSDEGSASYQGQNGVRPSHPSLKPTAGEASSERTLRDLDATPLPSTEATGDAASSVSGLRRERRERFSQDVRKIVPFAPKPGAPFADEGVIE